MYLNSRGAAGDPLFRPDGSYLVPIARVANGGRVRIDWLMIVKSSVEIGRCTTELNRGEVKSVDDFERQEQPDARRAKPVSLT